MVYRVGWLREALLGAKDGLVSTSSLVVGVAAAGSGSIEILIAGLAGLVAGAMSVAAGEYVSVSSQTDSQDACLARERRELADTPEAVPEELTRVYVDRGRDRRLAEQVATQLTEQHALGHTPATNSASPSIAAEAVLRSESFHQFIFLGNRTEGKFRAAKSGLRPATMKGGNERGKLCSGES